MLTTMSDMGFALMILILIKKGSVYRLFWFAPKQTSQENLGVRIQTKYVLTEDMVRKEIERITLEKSRKIACTEEAKKERIRKKNLIEAEKERKKKLAQEKKETKERNGKEKAAKKQSKSRHVFHNAKLIYDYKLY